MNTLRLFLPKKRNERRETSAGIAFFRRFLISLCTLSALAGLISVRADVLRTLSEQKEGRLVRITENEAVFLWEEEERSYPLGDVLLVDFQAAVKPPPENLAYHQVKLIDGTLLYCQEVGLRGAYADARLFSGTALRIPLDSVQYVIFEAQDEKNRKGLQEELAAKPTQDVLLLKSRDGTAVNSFKGFIGAADEKGEKVSFKRDGGNPVGVDLPRVRGLLFSRKEGKPLKQIGKLHDTGLNVFSLQKIQSDSDGYQMVTPSGLELKLSAPLVQKIDLSVGKVAYLSDLEPIAVEETPILSHLWRYRRDQNLEGGPLSLDRRTYEKGLAVHSRAVLTYDVAGYNFFRCVLGIDDQVGGYAHALVQIEGDGRELFSSAVTTRDKPRELNVPLMGVKQLRIIVDYGEDLDIGDHVLFADAQVTK